MLPEIEFFHWFPLIQENASPILEQHIRREHVNHIPRGYITKNFVTICICPRPSPPCTRLA
jgi:hypothetical protein